MSKNPAEKIKKLDEQIRIIQEQRKRLLAESKKAERKARTKQLIEIGAIMSTIGINAPDLALALKEKLLHEKNILQKTLLENEISKIPSFDF